MNTSSMRMLGISYRVCLNCLNGIASLGLNRQPNSEFEVLGGMAFYIQRLDVLPYRMLLRLKFLRLIFYSG